MSNLRPDAVVRAIRSVVGDGARRIALHEPEFRGNEWRYVKECLDSTFVSSIGKYVDKFEEMLAAYTGAARAVAVVNGTVALQVCLELAGVEEGDEVIVPALSFVATANAVMHARAMPHFVDVDERTLGMSAPKLAAHLSETCELRDGKCISKTTRRRISAVVPMHTFGHPVDIDAIMDVASRYGLSVIEDAAESLGSFYKRRHTGNFGKLAALSFNGNKIITTGGGGAILTNDPELGSRAKHLTSTARVPHAWEFIHDQVGYNFRLPNLNAALGCAQMESLPRRVEQKRSLAAKYADAFSGIAGVRFFDEPRQARSNYWLNALVLDAPSGEVRDAVLQATNDAGLMTRPCWRLLHTLPMYCAYPRDDLSVAESLVQRVINIPSSAGLDAH